MTKSWKPDQIDLRILKELQRNGRVDNNDLAFAVGLSASSCLQRVRRLEAAGYITGYSARLNLAKLGNPQQVFTQFTLSSHRNEDFLRFEAALRSLDQVMEVYLTCGGMDYLVKFVANSIDEYQALIDGLLASNLGIYKYFSFIVMKAPVARTEYPMPIQVESHKD